MTRRRFLGFLGLLGLGGAATLGDTKAAPEPGSTATEACLLRFSNGSSIRGLDDWALYEMTTEIPVVEITNRRSVGTHNVTNRTVPVPGHFPPQSS